MLINKVEEMKNQRTTLETQLREQLRKDDITSRIVTTEGANLKVAHPTTAKYDCTLVKAEVLLLFL